MTEVVLNLLKILLVLFIDDILLLRKVHVFNLSCYLELYKNYSVKSNTLLYIYYF